MVRLSVGNKEICSMGIIGIGSQALHGVGKATGSAKSALREGLARRVMLCFSSAGCLKTGLYLELIAKPCHIR